MERIRRGDIIIANLEPIAGSEQGGIRPVLVIQNDIINIHSPTTIIAPITSRIYTKEYPTNVQFLSADSGLKKESTIFLVQNLQKEIVHLSGTLLYRFLKLLGQLL